LARVVSESIESLSEVAPKGFHIGANIVRAVGDLKATSLSDSMLSAKNMEKSLR
jgi:hypothetical protein